MCAMAIALRNNTLLLLPLRVCVARVRCACALRVSFKFVVRAVHFFHGLDQG